MATTVDLVYAERLCVLCEALTGKALVHAPRVFTAGSLRCVHENCPNPHHRTAATQE